MIPKCPWILIGSLACGLMMASCAGSPPISVAPPRLTLPQAARTPCRLDRLPDSPTLADLEASYMTRGQALAECDAARRAAIETLTAERALLDRWLQTDP